MGTLKKRRAMKNKAIITESRIYFLVVLLISAATLRHSAIGFASFEGDMRLGVLSALAVDGLMVLFMYTLRREFRWRLFVAMCFPMGISIFTQLLYAMGHAQVITVAPGAVWLEQRAVDIINARVWILPIALPVSALLAALVGESETEQTVSLEQHEQLQAQLNQARQTNTDMRLEIERQKTATQQAQEKSRELVEFHAAVTDPSAWKDATSITQTIDKYFTTNGNKPAARELAEATGVQPATIHTARRKAKEAQPRLPGVNGE